MSLKETTRELKELLQDVSHDLEKAEGGNKAASQRVRTGTVKLEKLSKVYRKQSISSEKGPSAKKPSRSGKATVAAKKNKPAAKSHVAGSSHNKHKKPAGKTAAKASVASRPLAVKRPAKHHAR